MKFTKKNKYILLALLIILNIIVRYPRMNHEVGIDGFFIHSLANSISTFGFAKWIIHPLSFFGLYPLSYASAEPFILSGFSQVTGVSIEYIILFLGMFLGIFGMLSAYILAKKIRDDDLFAFLTAFVFSLSPLFLVFTIWIASTRNLFMGFLPIFIWAILKFRKSFKVSHVGIVIMFFILLIASHRLWFFLPLVLIALIATVLLTYIFNLKSFDKNILNMCFFYILLGISLLFFYTEFLSGASLYSGETEYQTGYFFSGTDILTILLNVGIDYVGKMGILLPFIFIGFIMLIRKVAYIGRNELFLLLVVIFLIPIIIVESYAPEFVLPFYALMISLGIIGVLNRFEKRKIFTASILVICLFATVGFAFFMFNHWHIGEPPIDGIYHTAIFIQDRYNHTAIANTGLLAAQISAFSEKPCLPFGGAYVPSQSPEQLIFGFVDKRDIVVRPLRFSEFPSKIFYKILKAPDQNMDWQIMLGDPRDDKVKEVLSRYNARLIVEYDLGGKYQYWKLRYSGMLRYLHESGDRIYHNGKLKIFYLR